MERLSAIEALRGLAQQEAEEKIQREADGETAAAAALFYSFVR